MKPIRAWKRTTFVLATLLQRRSKRLLHLFLKARARARSPLTRRSISVTQMQNPCLLSFENVEKDLFLEKTMSECSSAQGISALLLLARSFFLFFSSLFYTLLEFYLSCKVPSLYSEHKNHTKRRRKKILAAKQKKKT